MVHWLIVNVGVDITQTSLRYKARLNMPTEFSPDQARRALRAKFMGVFGQRHKGSEHQSSGCLQSCAGGTETAAFFSKRMHVEPQSVVLVLRDGLCSECMGTLNGGARRCFEVRFQPGFEYHLPPDCRPPPPPPTLSDLLALDSSTAMTTTGGIQQRRCSVRDPPAELASWRRSGLRTTRRVLKWVRNVGPCL